jgi:phosphohistidine phosphatase
MKRELWLLRHGKAERYDGSEDFDRRLKKRGKRDATRMGEWLKEQGLLPDLVISSPATRAIMTAKLVCDALEIDRQHIQLEKRLYDEGFARVKSVLAECPSTFNRVLLVGHNPEFEDLLTYLINSTDIPDVEKLLPTAALARLVLPTDWTQLEKGCAELPSITYPKLLAEEFEDPFD